MQLAEEYLIEEELGGEEELSEDAERQIELLRQLALECITCFFIDKQCSSGGPIPNHVLYHEKNVNMLMQQIEITEGVDRVYKTLEKFYNSDECIEKVLNILGQCGKRFIPKEFAAGLMIMYFRLCEGLIIE